MPIAANETGAEFSQRQRKNGILGAAARWKDHIKIGRAPEEQREHRNKRQREYRARTGAKSKCNANGERYESQREYRRRWGRLNREKCRAHLALHRAVKNGALKKFPCVVCSDLEVHGHHHNGYENPLDVVWLCPAHHRAAHSGQESR